MQNLRFQLFKNKWPDFKSLARRSCSDGRKIYTFLQMAYIETDINQIAKRKLYFLAGMSLL